MVNAISGRLMRSVAASARVSMSVLSRSGEGFAAGEEGFADAAPSPEASRRLDANCCNWTTPVCSPRSCSGCQIGTRVRRAVARACRIRSAAHPSAIPAASPRACSTPAPAARAGGDHVEQRREGVAHQQPPVFGVLAFCNHLPVPRPTMFIMTAIHSVPSVIGST